MQATVHIENRTGRTHNWKCILVTQWSSSDNGNDVCSERRCTEDKVSVWTSVTGCLLATLEVQKHWLLLANQIFAIRPYFHRGHFPLIRREAGNVGESTDSFFCTLIHWSATVNMLGGDNLLLTITFKPIAASITFELNQVCFTQA